MKNIMIDLQYPSKIPGSLQQELHQSGCSVFYAVPERLYPEAHALILTDNPSTVLHAKAADIACIAYEDPSHPPCFTNTDLIIQNLDFLTFTLLIRTYQRHHNIPWEIAQTPRLRIRESIPQDFAPLYTIYQAPGICDYMPGMTQAREIEETMFLSYIRSMYPFYEYGLWTIVESSSGQVVGRAGLENGSFRGKSVLEAGYMIGIPWQNRGYATEAMQAVMKYAIRELEAEKIYAFITPQNQPSKRVARRLHMERVEKDCWFYDSRKSAERV